MSDRTNVSVDVIHADHLSRGKTTVTIQVYDRPKDSRKKDPVYVLELEDYMAAYLAKTIVDALHERRRALESYLADVGEKALQGEDES